MDALGLAPVINSVLDSILTVCALVLLVGSGILARRVATLLLSFGSRGEASS